MKKIMVVDDDPRLNEALSVMLRENTFEVCTASNGLEAIREYESVKPDLILTDISMPDMEGIELLRILKKKNKSLPIIVMSGNTVGEGFLKSALLFGAASILKKPFSFSELRIAIDKAYKS